MLGRLFLLFTLLPLVELVLLIWIGAETSWMVSVALVLGTGLLGAWLIRLQGWQTLARIRADVAAGRAPAQSLLDGLFVFVAGVLLITPGVITDVLAIALLLPPTRRVIQRVLLARWQAQLVSQFARAQSAGARFAGAQGQSTPRRDQIIDVRVIDVDSRPSA